MYGKYLYVHPLIISHWNRTWWQEVPKERIDWGFMLLHFLEHGACVSGFIWCVSERTPSSPSCVISHLIFLVVTCSVSCTALESISYERLDLYRWQSCEHNWWTRWRFMTPHRECVYMDRAMGGHHTHIGCSGIFIIY